MTTHPFTPGPWKAEGKGGTNDGGSIRQHPCFNGRITAFTGTPIIQDHCFLGVQGATPLEAEANAHLIAAAPEFVLACQSFIERHDREAKEANYQQCGCDDCLTFRKIIKKALGE